MKQQSGLRLTIIAVICGILAAALTVFYLKQIESKYRKASIPPQKVTVAVVVPNADLSKGIVLTAQNVASRNVPKEFLPSNAVMASDFKKLVNRTLLMPVQKGRPITWEAVTGKSARTFSENIELGRRSRSVKVNKIDSFDGLLRPGDRIDLMGNFTMSSLGMDNIVKTGVSVTPPEDIVMPILENVEVLAAGREDLHGRKYEYNNNKSSVDGFDMEFTIVNLNLTPKQIARVELAENLGNMFAVLRHPKDTSVAEFEYVDVNLLFEKDEEGKIDLVMGADGKPIGQVIGDNIVDENGNIVGKVVNGKAVTFDGKPLGTIVNDVDQNDPVLQVAETADVVRDANGNIIGKVVDGKILDADGKVIGEVKDGKAVGLDGQSLGRIDKNVALDANGNEVDLSSSVAQNVGQPAYQQEVVRDANGNIIGKVVNGQVVDAAGNVIGKVNADGTVQGLDGRKLGEIETVVMDSNGNVVGSEEQVVRDADGNIIGKVVNGQVVDADGNVIGQLDESGQAVGLDGQKLGEVATVMVDENGEVLANVAEVVRDANGNVIGRVVDGKVLDADGNVIGQVDASGQAVGLDGRKLGKVEQVMTDSNGRLIEESVELVRDANGNVIGQLVNGQVVDENGEVIGVLKDGQVVDLAGNVLVDDVSVDSASPNRNQGAVPSTVSEFVDFIAGGTADDGIVPVIRIKKQ